MPKRGNDLQSRLLATFRAEAREHLEAIGNRLLALEGGLSGEGARVAAEEIFRVFHTLKGAARSVNLMEVERAAQACESALSAVTRGHAAISSSIVKALRETANGIERLVRREAAGPEVAGSIARLEAALAGVESPLSDAAPSLREPVPVQTMPDTVRLSTAQLDALLVRAEDLLTFKLAAAERARDAAVLLEAVHGVERAQNRAALLEGVKSARVRARDLAIRLREDERAVAAGVDALQSFARGLRMSPAASALGAFPRMVKDLAESHGKEVDWVAEGTSLEIDRKVIDTLKDPLLHLVRNAIDHGIEPGEQRLRAGKARRGRIHVRFASLEAGRIEISVADDGGGIDPERVKAAAVRLRQLTQEQIETLRPAQVLDLVFRSGISTAPVITAISGHGLGLAIVREAVERLGGEVRLETAAGQGTKVRLIVPASISTFSGLLVRCSERLFLIETGSVERVLRIESEHVRSVEGRETLFVDQKPIAIAPLAAMLGLPGPEGQTNGIRTCLVVAMRGERLAVSVDEIVGEREVVVKELRPPLIRVPFVSGAGLLGSGDLALILRPADLLRAGREPRREAPAVSGREHERVSRILVVDDSITTRTMEKNLLEAAGYAVQVAVDGSEAWTLLKSQQFDLVLSDVDMPRMDGFELTRRIRDERKLADLPVVLVTALESREDKERGIEVGANAYVVKSSFDQSNLLEILRRLL